MLDVLKLAVLVAVAVLAAFVAIALIGGAAGWFAGAVWSRIARKERPQKILAGGGPAAAHSERLLVSGRRTQWCDGPTAHARETVALTVQTARLVANSRRLLSSSGRVLDRSRELSRSTVTAISQSRLLLIKQAAAGAYSLLPPEP